MFLFGNLQSLNSQHKTNIKAVNFKLIQPQEIKIFYIYKIYTPKTLIKAASCPSNRNVEKSGATTLSML